MGNQKSDLKVRVKICGITNLADAQIASSEGADFLGFIFYPRSKRGIPPSAARLIINELRRKQKLPILVGVFVNETIQNIARILQECDLDLAQLSGNETPNYVGDPKSPIYGRCYKAIRPQSLAEAEAELEWYSPPQPSINQPSILVDSYHQSLYGGTGKIANWDVAASLARNTPNMMLAGGLRPENVALAIRHVHPYAVDVASGVEIEPGKKDPAKINRFINNAKGVTY